MLTIREFVANSIIEIAQGLNDVQKAGIDGLTVFPRYKNSESLTTDVSFDLAVTASASDQLKNEGGWGISVIASALGFKTGSASAQEEKAEASNVSRLQFTVKVHFPGDSLGTMPPMPRTRL
jgi:hypothetical protein